MLSLYKNNNGHTPWSKLISRWQSEARANQLTSKTLKGIAKETPDPTQVMPAMLGLFNHYQMHDSMLRELLIDVTSYWIYTYKPGRANSHDEIKKYIIGLCRANGVAAEAVRALSLPATSVDAFLEINELFKNAQMAPSYILVDNVQKPILVIKGVTTVSIVLMGLARRVHLTTNRESRTRVNDLILRWIYSRENPDREKFGFKEALGATESVDVVVDKTISLDVDWEIKRDLALGFGEKHLSNFTDSVKTLKWPNPTILSAWLGHIYWPYWMQSMLVDYEWDSVRRMKGITTLPAVPSRLAINYKYVPIRSTYYAQFWSGQPTFLGGRTSYSSVGWHVGKKQVTLADIARQSYDNGVKGEYTLSEPIQLLVYGPNSLNNQPWSIYEKYLYEMMDRSALSAWMLKDERWFLYLIDPPLYNLVSEKDSLTEKEWLDKVYSNGLMQNVHWLVDKMFDLLPKSLHSTEGRITASQLEVTMPATLKIVL